MKTGHNLTTGAQAGTLALQSVAPITCLQIIRVEARNMTETSDVTILLNRISDGDGDAPEQLLPLVYGELRKLAHSYMQN